MPELDQHDNSCCIWQAGPRPATAASDSLSSDGSVDRFAHPAVQQGAVIADATASTVIIAMGTHPLAPSMESILTNRGDDLAGGPPVSLA